MLGGMNPGQRLQGMLGGGPADMGQTGGGPLGGGQPGERLMQLLQRGGNVGPDVGQDGENVDVPDEPGPAVAGRTPVVGTVRRSNGLPVARDQLSGAME